MAKTQENIKTMPYLLALNQIEIPQLSTAETSKRLFEETVETLQTAGFNAVLPIVCLTPNEDQYHLLTGLPIYEAAKTAGLQEIWVFLIALPLTKAAIHFEQIALLSKLNDIVIESQDVTSFLAFLNDPKADLRGISGIGEKTAQKIIDHRPYASLEDVQQKLNKKRGIFNWLRSFKRV
jgi:hypothetical protein